MKGDRMPTILPQLAMEEYTDTWFDFLLDPIKLNNHLKDISSGKSNHPNVSMIIKTFLKQFEKYTVLQQQHILQQQLDNISTTPTTTSPSSSPTSTTTSNIPASSATSSSANATTTSKRSKLIIDLVINVITNLKFSLDDFEKNIPIKHQRTILEQLESKTDVDIEYQTFLNRWVLRGIIKGTPIKYLLSNYTSSPSSPNLQSMNNGNSNNSNNTTPSGCPSTPPSTPPPTPPSFISLQQSQQPQQQSLNSSDTNTSLEELFYKSNLFLNEWISENYDEDKPSDIDQVVPIVLFELGEFQFYKENFYDARKLFDRANKIITSPKCLAIIDQSIQQFKIESSNIKGVVGNKLQQLSEYKEKIQCLIIACKTIDLYDNGDQQKMDTDSTTTSTNDIYENNKNFQIEKALSSNNIQQVIKILDLDMLDYNSSTSLDFNFRLNLEFNILPSKSYTTNGQLSTTLLNVHFGNLIKSTIIQYQHYNYSLDEFKQISKESVQIFFSLVQVIFKQGNQIYTNRIEFLLFKIFNIISNDHKLQHLENNNFIQILRSTLPTLFKKFNSTTTTSSNGGKVDIQFLFGSGTGTGNSLLFNNFIKENEPIKINNLLELLKKQFNLGVQQCNSILYQKSLDLFEQGELEKSKTILIEYLGGSSSKSYNSIDYQLYLYNLILKTYKQQQQELAAVAGSNKIKTSTILVDSFKLLLAKHGPPSEYIAERIFAILLNKRKWEVTKSISNILKSNSDQCSASFSELVYIANHLASIGKMVDSEDKERIKQLALSASIQSSIDSAISTSSSSNIDDKTNNSNNNGNNNNNGGSNTHENSDREDSDMDIDDNFTSPTTYTTNSSNQSTSTTTSTPTSSSNSKLTINSKSEDIYIGFLSSILPRYEQKSIHWTFIIGNKFNSKNSNQVAGLLNLLDIKSLYHRIVFLFVGLIHSIQAYKKVQNDLNLDLYNEFSTRFSNTIIFPNKHFSIEIEPLILNVYLDTLNRMNKIFGIKIDEKEKKLQLQPGIESMTVFKNGRNLIYIGDIYFEKKFHRESLRYYLLGCSLENAFFSDSTKTLITNSKYLSHLSRRLFDCFYFLRAPMQAIVVSQLFGSLNQTCLVSFKIIQEEYYQLDPNYFQYIWEIPLLEILLNTFTKQKDIKKVYLLNQILSNPNINEFNHPEIRKNYINNSKINFFKDISSSYLLS